MAPRSREPVLTTEMVSMEEVPSLKEAISMKVLQRIDTVSNLCDAVLTARWGVLPCEVRLVAVLQGFRHALEPLQRQVKQVNAGIVDKARFSTYQKLYSICLKKLISAEGTLALLSEKLNILNDGNDIALLDKSIKKGSNVMRPRQASSAPLDEIIDTILRLLKRQGTSLHLCQQVHSLMEAYSEIEFRSALNSASNGGHKELLRFLTDTFNHDTSPLKHTMSGPSFVNHKDIVQSSLALEADLDSPQLDYGNALQEASFAGNEKLVRTLFHQKVDVNAQGGYYGNALQAASFAGHVKIVKCLIERNADVNAQGGYYGNALQAASFFGHQDIVQLLLDQQVDVNAQGGHYGNALQAASFAGHKDIVIRLFHNNANRNAQGGYFGNALQAASFAGHEKIVKFLFHRKANVNALGGFYGNALQAASFTGHEQIVKFLFRNKANVDALGGFYGNALQAASFAGHQSIVEFLIHQKANVNAQIGYYGNALQAASLAGHQKIVRCLLRHEIDIDAKGGYHGNALQAASFAGHLDIVQRLLGHGADVNTRGGYHGNALQAASFAGHLDIVQMLLGHGADVDAQGLHGTALDAALSNGHEDVVEFLYTVEPDNGIRNVNHYALVIQIAVWLLGNGLFQSLLVKAFESNIQIETFRENLTQLIERYGEDLIELTRQQKLKSAAKEFVFHRWPIVEAIFSLYTSMKRAEGENEVKLTNSRIQAVLENRLAMMVDDSDELKLKLSKDEIDEVTRYLASIPMPLHSFLGSVCRLVYVNPLEAVRAELLRGLEDRTGSCRVRFELSWRIDEYLGREIVKTSFGEIDRRIISSLLTLSGDAQQCYANSCEVYMKWKWPYTYKILLEALALGSDCRAFDTLPMMPGSVYFCSDHCSFGGATIIAFGSEEFLIEIAQQLSWLTASIRLPINGQVSLSDSLLISSGAGFVSDSPLISGDAGFEVPVYKVLTLPLHRAPEIENSCWLPLFLGTVIARNYLIPERGQERGLELPFDLMAAVAGIMVPKYHDGGIYLKGYSRLLYPVSGSVAGSVQWHLITSASRRVSLPDDLICAQNWMKMLDRRLLSSVPRTFLGYCREVIVDLGTNKAAAHYKEISFSGAKDATQGLWIQPPSSLTWGTSGMNIFGASFTHSIVYGKSLAQTVTGNNDDYLDVLEHALRTPIILYDDETHRGWMITAFVVIIHMIRTWSSYQNCFQSSLPCLTTSMEAENAPHSDLASKWNLVVRNSPNEDMCKNKIVKDLVMEFWHGIQSRYEEDLFARRQLGPGVELTSAKLHGWDYMDLITGRPSCKKQLDFDGNWIDLTREVTVFFGGGFGDVIQPAPGVSICAAWNPIPPKKMHLTATIDCIQKLSSVRGHPANLTSAKLTHKSYWNHDTSNLFTDCTECRRLPSAKPQRVTCPKALQTLDSSAQKSNHGSAIPAKGAIVFGKQPKTMRYWWGKKHLSKMPSQLKSQSDNLQRSELVPQPSVACKMVYVSENPDSTNENTGEVDIQLSDKGIVSHIK